MWYLWCACFQEINFLKNQDVQDFFHIIFKILIYSLAISYLHIHYIYVYIYNSHIYNSLITLLLILSTPPH